ncbi:acyltransferase family protein [Butyrivibrio fibrisolvens]|uniref:acyltransferase family protein n=1 Tax=Butyrivibrio fibrisolvens TaxID=831 RepID=UPI00200AF92B|nr:acyltransferase family protein [Butyrivibrio fibrisolvens]
MTKVKYADYSKALAIFFVIMGHMIEMTNVGDGKWIIDTLCYLLHVPTFLIISGYLFSKSYMKHTLKEVIITKSIRLLFPYLIWTLLLTLYTVIINGMSLGDSFCYSSNALWYLAFLWACIICTSFLFKLPNFISKMIMLLLSLCCVASPFLNSTLAKFCIHYGIFLVGFIYLDRIIASRNKYILIAMFISGYMCLVATGYLSMLDALGTGIKTLSIFILKIMGACFLPICFSYIEEKKELKLLTKVGASTIYIYVLHFFIIAIYKNMNNDDWFVYIISVLVVFVFTMAIGVAFENNKYLNKLFSIL